MAFLSWRMDYEVGVKQIDSEHQTLFNIINEFHDNYARGDFNKKTPYLLNALVAYTEEHFQHEEKLMSENDYPLFDKHSEQHSDLVTSIFTINERLENDPAKASAETMQFVKKWLCDHILKNDMDFADYLKRRAKQTKNADQDKSGEQLKDQPKSESAYAHSTDSDE